MNDEAFDKKISLKFIQTLNKHLPSKRKVLNELLLEDKPSIKNQDGTTHSFDKKELEKLSSFIPERDCSVLRLPIYLEMSASLEGGNIKISGRIECRIINKILGIPEKNGGTGDSMIIHYPHLAKIRKEFSTTTQFMFTM